jgi:hypothetical protein
MLRGQYSYVLYGPRSIVWKGNVFVSALQRLGQPRDSSPSRVEPKNEGAIPPLTPTRCGNWWSLGKTFILSSKQEAVVNSAGNLENHADILGARRRRHNLLESECGYSGCSTPSPQSIRFCADILGAIRRRHNRLESACGYFRCPTLSPQSLTFCADILVALRRRYNRLESACGYSEF